MGFVFNKYKNMLIEFVRKEKLFLFLIIITCVASYGFTITHFSIGIDDTAVERYLHGGELLAQGRFGAVLLDKIFGVMVVIPFWVDFLAVLVLAFAAIIWSILFKSVAKDRIKSGALIVFATLFVSYPIINEIFIYMPASLSICMGYLLTGIALILSYEFIIDSKKISVGILSVLFICFAVSLYESFAAVYICGFFAVLIIKYFFQDEDREPFKKYILYIIKFCIVLLIAVVLDLVIANFLMRVLELTRSTNAQNAITWFNGGSKLQNLRNLIKAMIHDFGYMATSYQPIFGFLITCILTAVIAFVLAFRFKSITPFILMMGLGISNISLSLVQGVASPYRTCQAFAIFIGFVWMLFVVIINGRFKKVILYSIIFLLVLSQTKDLNHWFYNDYRRFEIDKTNILHIAQTIEDNYGRSIQKPIVFIGDPGGIEDIEWNQTNGQSFLKWGVTAFGETSPELLKFMDIYGYRFVQATYDQVEEAKTKSENMPSWPTKGYISEFKDYIVVKLGVIK